MHKSLEHCYGYAAVAFTGSGRALPHDRRVLRKELSNGLLHCARAFAVDDSDPRVARYYGVVQISVQLVHGLTHRHSAQVDLSLNGELS